MDLDISFVHGADAPPLLDCTLGQALELARERWPDREAIVACESGARMSYAQLNSAAEEFGAGLLALGLRPGERIGIWSPNCAEWAVTQYAAAKAGLILVNINPAYRRHELEFVLNKVGCSALVVAARFKSSDYLGMLLELAPELTRCEPGALSAHKLPRLKLVISIEATQFDGFVPFSDVATRAQESDRDALRQIGASLRPHDPVNIQFTSGTTGSPKGATLSHHNIINNSFFVGEAIRTGLGDRICIPVPLYHCFGMCMGNLNCLTHGATAVYPSCSRFSRSAARRCTASPPCSSPCSITRDSRKSTYRACAAGSWQAPPAPSPSCSGWSTRCTCPKSPSPTA
jgi:fatty-acyl-CoA synthase